MANFTKNEIKKTFLNLLTEKPLNEISVKMLTESCGINRKTFYYHYDSIPELLEEYVYEKADEFIKSDFDINSIEECLDAGVKYAIAEKKATMHIYNSVNRTVFDSYLLKVIDYIVRKYVIRISSDYEVCDKDKELLINSLKSCVFGVIINWIENDMNEEIIPDIHRIIECSNGSIESILKKMSESR